MYNNLNFEGEREATEEGLKWLFIDFVSNILFPGLLSFIARFPLYFIKFRK